MKSPKTLVCGLVVSLALTLVSHAASVLKPNDRIIFIGDSITGQGRNISNGWANLIDEQLKASHPEANLKSVSLGGSGHGVGSWQGIERKSRDGAVILDVKTVDVKATLDASAEVFVIMLGMNDVLFPRLKDRPEDLEHWAEQYRELIAALRQRAHPRVVALATPTMCTEDINAPKNVVMKELIAKVQEVAKSENCIVLPTFESMAHMLDEGRTWSPNFHVTVDFVHPTFAGHVAIAEGMLKGLGEEIGRAHV